MDRELIVQALKNSCGNKNLKFQVVVRQDQLYIYINRRGNYQPNYLLLEENITAAIASLAWDNLDGVWLYSRPLGKIEPDWQTFIELPNQVTCGNDNTFAQTEDLESDVELANFEFPYDNSTGNTELLHNTGMIHKNILKESEISFVTTSNEEVEPLDLSTQDFAEFEIEPEDSTGDTGFLNDTGFVHGSPLKEEDFNSLATGLTKPIKLNSLNQYCFVTNENLLTGEVTPPNKEIMRLVKFFHHLSDSQRFELLPILDNYFKRGKIFHLEDQSTTVQNWLKQISELNDEDHHVAAIWLSRYCASGSSTLEEFKTIAANEAANTVNEKAPNLATEYSFTPANTKTTKSRKNEALKSSKPKFKLPPVVKKLFVPAAWILATVVLLNLGIVSNNSVNVVGDQQILALCNSSLGSPEYCRLAVNLAGAKTIERSPQRSFPLTEVTETIANYGCQRYVNLKAGIPFDKIAPEITPVISSTGEKIFPHIYVVEAQQKNFQRLGNTKVGCVYTIGKGQRSPKKLAADVIPLGLPNQQYQQPKTNLAFGRYTKPINLGLYTIFAALGIAIAAWLNIGIKIKQPSTIYLVALILGIAQLIATSLPFFSLLATIALPILAILTVSLTIKNFQLDWSRGYPLIATSILIVITVQFLFYSLCLELITSSL